MIAPRKIAELVGSSTLDRTKAAIVAELGRLLPGVKVIAHPGKLDINDVVAKAVVDAPGIAIGWSRCRTERDVAGGFRATIDWTAYVVVEDYVDLLAKRSTPREVVGHAIGAALLEILDDPGTASWGIPGLGYPLADPAPTLTPLMTMRSADNKTDFYAVTWSQAAWGEGHSYFGGATPQLARDEATGEITATFDDDLGDVLPAAEIRAMIREAEGGSS